MSDSVLIVEDNLDNLEVASLALESDRFSVRTAQDASQALHVLETFHPDLVLMDIQLPGIDGLELTRMLRQRRSLDDVVIVALSAYAMKGDEEIAREAGCDGYITKPINTRTFGQQVRKYLLTGAAPRNETRRA